MRRHTLKGAPFLLFLFSPALAQTPGPTPELEPTAIPEATPPASDPSGRAPDGAVAEGLAGTAGVISAIDDDPGTMRAVWQASYFSADDFGKTGVALTGLGSSVGVGWSPSAHLALALVASGASYHGDGMFPESVQALGDLLLSAVWTPYRSGGWRAGGRAGVALLAGGRPFEYGDAVTPFVDAIGSGRIGPVRLSANAGYVADRSEALLPAGAMTPPALRAAYGVAAGPHARVSVVSSAPLADGRVEPFVALKGRAYFGDVESGDTVLGASGLIARFGSAGRTVAIEAGLTAALVTGEESAARPLEPPVRAHVGLSLVLPPARPVPVVRMVEVPAPPPPPTTGDIEGLVRDARSGEPLAWVIVDVPGVTQNPILSDAAGVFRIKGLPPGGTKVRVQKQGYAVTTVPVEVVAGTTATADVTLGAGTSRGTGVFAGDIRSRDGKPVAARLTFTYGNESRAVQADAAGKVQISLPPGTFTLKVEAAGFLPQTRTLSVAGGEQTVFNFVLIPVQP